MMENYEVKMKLKESYDRIIEVIEKESLLPMSPKDAKELLEGIIAYCKSIIVEEEL